MLNSGAGVQRVTAVEPMWRGYIGASAARDTVMEHVFRGFTGGAWLYSGETNVQGGTMLESVQGGYSIETGVQGLQ